MLVNPLMPVAGAAATLDADRFQAWVGTLPFDHPGVAARALITELQRLRGASNIRTRLKLLEVTVEAAKRLAHEAEKALAEAALPLSPELQQVFVAANGLLKLLAAAYAGIANEIAGKWIGIGFARPLRTAVLRAMHFHAQRLALAYRVYARGSNSAWAELHRLYRMAREAGFATAAPSGHASAEQIYVNALLLAFAEPTKLAPGELERVRFYIERHARFAELVDAPAARQGEQPLDACFLIKPKEARAGRSLMRAARLPVEAGDLVLRCTKLLAKLQGQLGGVEKGIEPARVGLPLAARQPQYQALLRNLHRLWSAPPMRRFTRQHFKPRVDIVVGFDALWSFLAGPAFRRRTADGGQDPSAPELSEWAIANESPGGFALQYIGGNAGPVRVGEVVGLRPREQSTVYLCLTRRVVSGDLQNVELGLQKLAPAAIPTVVAVPGPGGKGGASARQVHVIVVPRLPAQGNVPALIALPQTVASGMRIAVSQEGGEIAFQVGAALERCPSCEMFLLEAPAA